MAARASQPASQPGHGARVVVAQVLLRWPQYIQHVCVCACVQSTSRISLVQNTYGRRQRTWTGLAAAAKPHRPLCAAALATEQQLQRIPVHTGKNQQRVTGKERKTPACGAGPITASPRRQDTPAIFWHKPGGSGQRERREGGPKSSAALFPPPIHFSRPPLVVLSSSRPRAAAHLNLKHRAGKHPIMPE